MERRNLLKWISGLSATGMAASASAGPLAPDVWLAQASPAMPHDHAAMMAAQAAAAPRRFDALIPAYQACTQAADVCIAHCQTLLAEGDKSLGTCLRTALDAEAVCNTVLKLAGLNSRFTGNLASASIVVMQACVDACKEHVDHHAQCKACHDACVKAIAAARPFA